jgi:hypothetical protein
MVDHALLRRKNLVLGSLLVGFVFAVMGRTMYVMWPDMTEREIAAIEQRYQQRKNNNNNSSSSK